KQMQQYADALEFEMAEDIRHKLDSLKVYMTESTVVNPGLGNFHVFGFTEEDTPENKKAYINYMYVYEGTIIKTKAIILQKNLDESKEELMQFAIIDTLGRNAENMDVLLPFEVSVENDLINISVPKI